MNTHDVPARQNNHETMRSRRREEGPASEDAWQQGILLAGGATFSPVGPAEPCLRFNVVLSQHVRLTRYLEQRLEAVAQGRGTLERLARS